MKFRAKDKSDGAIIEFTWNDVFSCGARNNEVRVSKNGKGILLAMKSRLLRSQSRKEELCKYHLREWITQ